MTTYNLQGLKRRMEGALNVLHQELTGLRTGRAAVSLLEPVSVEAYGSHMPLNQLATVSAPEARLLTVQVWDKTMVKAVEKAIRDGGLGLNPVTEGQLLRVPIPELTEERRKEMAKLAHKYGEDARVAVRNVRRDGMDALKRMEKAGDMSQDEHRAEGEKVQEMTDEMIKRIGASVDSKEQEILQI